MTTPIDYAPPLPWHRRKLLRRALIAIVILLLFALAAYYFGPAVYRRARILYWQHRCMNHVDPPTKVAARIRTDIFPFEVLSHTPCEDSVSLERSLAPNLPPYPGWWSGSVFVHSRKSAAVERLVVVECYFATPLESMFSPKLTQITILEPGMLFSEPRCITCRGVAGDAAALPDNGYSVLTVYAGQPDPTDESAFTISFDLDSTRHEARYRLTPAGDAVDLVSITPPMK
jgi:hypothetical protein